MIILRFCITVWIVLSGIANGYIFSSNFGSKLNSYSSVSLKKNLHPLRRFSQLPLESASTSCSTSPIIVASALPVQVSESASSGLQLAGLFTLWYGFNAGYNVFNAFVKKSFPFPLASAALQLLVGMAYAVPLWALKVRKVPNLTPSDVMRLLPIG